MSELDIRMHDDCSFSIKDLSRNDIDLSSYKWTPIFERIVTNYKHYYFFGSRVQIEEADLELAIGIMAEKALIENFREERFLFKIKPIHLTISRNYLSTCWNYFEYPALFFLNNQREESILAELLLKKVGYNDIFQQIKGALLIYQSFEQNVLWFEGSSEILKLINPDIE